MADYKLVEPALTYGSTIGSGVMAAGSITGSKSSLRTHYVTVAAQTAGSVGVNIFGGIAPTAGSVTGFYAVNANSTVGSAALWGTTAGTITVLQFTPGVAGTSGSTNIIGATLGTGLLNAAIVTGDNILVSAPNNSGTFTCYVSYQTTL